MSQAETQSPPPGPNGTVPRESLPEWKPRIQAALEAGDIAVFGMFPDSFIGRTEAGRALLAEFNGLPSQVPAQPPAQEVLVDAVELALLRAVAAAADPVVSHHRVSNLPAPAGKSLEDLALQDPPVTYAQLWALDNASTSLSLHRQGRLPEHMRPKLGAVPEA